MGISHVIDLDTHEGMETALRILLSGMTSGAATVLINAGMPEELASSLSQAIATAVYDDPAMVEEMRVRLFDLAENNGDSTIEDRSYVVSPRGFAEGGE